MGGHTLALVRFNSLLLVPHAPQADFGFREIALRENIWADLKKHLPVSFGQR